MDSQATGNRAEALLKIGCLHYPAPMTGLAAWQRRYFGEKSFSLCGVTHTTATEGVGSVGSEAKLTTMVMSLRTDWTVGGAAYQRLIIHRLGEVKGIQHMKSFVITTTVKETGIPVILSRPKFRD